MLRAHGWLAIALAASSSTALPAQQPQSPPQPPAFRSGVDLLTLQAAVLDAEGRPVRDLTASDFTVSVDGKPRRVVSARFAGAEVKSAAAPTTPTAGAPAATPRAAGRLVMFVVDRDTIQTGTEKALVQASGRVLDALTPADAVGLLGFPSGGVKPTREHQLVRSALNEVTGTMPRLGWRWHITWAEAEGIERGDKQMLAQALSRECRPPRKPPPDCPDCPVRVPEGCDTTLPAQAQEMLLTARSQARATLANLRGLATRLRPLRGPKHVVFMSGGMRFDQELLGEFNKFVYEAATAGIVLHTIHVDQPSTDVATERRPMTSAFGSREMTLGLTTVAGMTGGGFYYGVGTAAGVWERIGVEITNYYEIGVEAAPSDADGKPHKVSVNVSRPNLKVRTRSEAAVDASLAANRGTAEGLRTLLEQPTDILDLPLEVETFTTRGDDASLLKVLLTARLGGAAVKPPIQWGFVVISDENVLASGRSSVDAPKELPPAVTASAKLMPGKHRLRFVAVDANGQAGVVELPLTVGLRAADGLQMSDLMVGSNAGGRFLPGAAIQPPATIAALIEVLSADPVRLSKTRVALEILADGSTEPVQRLLMAARTGIADTILLNEAQLPAAALAPGRYTANATVLVDAQPVGRVSRPFEIRGIAR